MPHCRGLAHLCKGRGPTQTGTFYMLLSIKVKALKLFNDLRQRLIVHIPDFISLNENSQCMKVKFGFHYFFPYNKI